MCRYLRYLCCLFGYLLTLPVYSLEPSISGYARIIAGVVDDKDTRYLGYDNSLSLDQDSLIGIQGQLPLTSQLSITALAEAYGDSKKDAGVKWLYLKYQPITSTLIKIGKMRTPFYSKSDVLNVGYSYPWVTAPTEVYSDFIMKTFQGFDVRYAHLNENYSAYFEFYYGRFDDDLTVGDVSLEAKVDNLRGIIGELKIDHFTWRAAYHTGSVELDLPILQSFSDSLSATADTLGVELNDTLASLRTDGKAQFYQIGFEYDVLDYFVISEYTRVIPQQDFIPKIEGFYLTLGRYFDQVSAWITLGRRDDSLTGPQDELSGQINNTPTPTNQAEAISLATLQGLEAGYQQVYDSRSENDIRSWSVGLRWDFRVDSAFKVEFKRAKSTHKNNAIFINQNSSEADLDSNILLMGLEWIF